MRRLPLIALLLVSFAVAQDRRPFGRPGRNPRKEKSRPDKTPKARSIEDVARAITASDLRKLLTYVASDDLQGRCAGDPGNDKVTERFAKIYKDSGLEPGNGSSYFQPLTVGGRPTRNTIAVLRGTDRKNEYVILGAHHDHLGILGKGPPGQQLSRAPVNGDRIFNGADDNGSGSTAVVTIARVFGESGLRPRRTIVFMTFTGEEWGLVGSRYYCSHPIYPLSDTVAMINIDMIGRMNGQNLLNVYGLGTEAGDEWEAMVDRLGAKVGLKIRKIQGTRVGGGDSDHSSFRDKGVPDMFFMEGGGLHSDYHRVTDHVEKINFAGLERAARFAAYVVWELANTDKRWKFQRK